MIKQAFWEKVANEWTKDIEEKMYKDDLDTGDVPDEFTDFNDIEDMDDFLKNIMEIDLEEL